MNFSTSASREIERLELEVLDNLTDLRSHEALVDALLEQARHTHNPSRSAALHRLCKSYTRMADCCPLAIGALVVDTWEANYRLLYHGVADIPFAKDDVLLPPALSVGPVTLLFWHANHIDYYKVAIAMWCSCLGATDITTGVPPLIWPVGGNKSDLCDIPYAVSLDLSMPHRVRDAHRRISAIASTCGSAGLIATGDDGTECSALWLDLHRCLLELGGSSCLSEFTSSGTDGADGDTWADRLMKRSYLHMLRSPFEEAIHTAAADLYVAFGNARAEKTAAGLAQGTDRKKIMKAKKDLKIFEANKKDLKPAAGRASRSVVDQHHALLLAYAWELARTIDGVAAFTFLLHECVKRLIIQCALRLHPLNDLSFIAVAWPSMVKYLTAGLTSEASTTVASTKIGSLDSLSDMGDPTSGGNIYDTSRLVCPLISGFIDLLRLCNGTTLPMVSVVEPAVGDKRPREEGEEVEKASVQNEHEEEDLEPMWSGQSGLIKATEVSFAVALLLSRQISAAPNALRTEDKFITEHLVPLLTLAKSKAYAFLESSFSEIVPLETHIAQLRVHLTLKKAIPPKTLSAMLNSDDPDCKKLVGWLTDSPLTASQALSEAYCMALDAATSAINIVSFDDFSPAEVADGAFLVLSCLPTVSALAIPILEAPSNASTLEAGSDSPLSALTKAIETANQRWEGIWRKAKTLKIADESNPKGKEERVAQSALLRRVAAKIEEVVSALIDFRLNHLLMGTPGQVDLPAEALYLTSAQGKLL